MLIFNVRNQNISRIDNFSPAEKSENYLEATFYFKTEDWKDCTKTAIFENSKSKVIKDVILSNDKCLVPWEVLEEKATIKVSVYGINLSEKITTDMAEFSLNSTVSGGSATTEPTPDVYQQIIAMLDDIAQNGVTDEQIEKAVEKYFAENPIGGVDEAEVQRIVAEYVEKHKEELKGDKGESGADGKDGIAGKDGKDGFSPTVTVIKSGDVSTLTVTDKNGTTSVKIYDGKDGGDIVNVNAYESSNLLDLADVAEISKNGIAMTVVDEIITLNGTATANAELNLSSNFLEDGTYTFAYEILDGEFSGTLMYGYQSSKYVDLSGKQKTIEITSHNRTKVWVKSGSVCNNLKIHLWAVRGTEYKEWQLYGGITERVLQSDIKVGKLEEHIANKNIHITEKEKAFINRISGDFTIYSEEIADIANKVFKVTDNGAIVTVLLTDTHINPDDKQSIKQYEEMVANIAELTNAIPCDGVIHLGDHVNTQWWWSNRYTEDLEYQKYVHDYANMLRKANAPVYCIQGNHDGGFHPKNDETGTTGSEYSNHSIIYRNLGTITDKSAIRNICADVVAPYYYVDNAVTRTRMIFMTSNMENPNNDVKGFDYQTTVWLRNTLVEVEKDWNVLIFTHISCARFYTHLKNADKYIEIVNAFNEHRETTGLDSKLTADFTEYTGKIVAEIAGHYHGDSVVYPDNENARLSCIGIEIDSGSCLVGGGVITSGDFYDENDTNARSYDDITRHLFDVMVYRPDLNKIYMYRFGAGSDREITV